MLRRIFITIAVLILSLGMCYAQIQTRITGGICLDFAGIPEFSEVVEKTEGYADNQFWGIGWEVIIDHLGMGGNYYTDFRKDLSGQWSVNWYGEAFYLSYHLFHLGAAVDPFVQAGLGAAGSCLVGQPCGDAYSAPYIENRLMLSIFPFVSGGVVLELDRFLLGAKLNYTPVIEPVPVTNFETYPLDKIQLLIFTGVAFGAH
jgi:hypothetical protein